MSEHGNRHHFHGHWEVVAQEWQTRQSPTGEQPAGTGTPPTPRALTEIEVDSTGLSLSLSYDGGPRASEGPMTVTYDADTETLRNESKDLCLAFWRSPSSEHVFGMIDRQRVWTARKTLDSDSKLDRNTLSRFCGKWLITMRSGFYAAPLGCVRVKRLHIESESERNKVANLDLALLGLFEVPETGADKLYDILHYDSRVASFNSLFRVRSVKFLPGESRDGRDDRIFATFDNHWTLPVGHFGNVDLSSNHRLGQPLAWERPYRNAADSADSATLSEGPPPQKDPDTGCWCGEPPPPPP